MVGRRVAGNDLSSPKQVQNLILAMHTSQKLPTGLSWQYLFYQLFYISENNILVENTLQITPSTLLETLGTLSGELLSRPRDKNPKSSVLGEWERSPSHWGAFPWLSHFTCSSAASPGMPSSLHAQFIMTLLQRLSKPTLLSSYLKAAACHRCTSLSMQMMSFWTSLRKENLSLSIQFPWLP